MKIKLGGLLALFLSCTSTYAHVCDSIRGIKNFGANRLFDNAIINGTSLDYYSFSSSCDLVCIFNTLNRANINHTLSANNISIYDATSVATITVDSINKGVVTGYLTCSVAAKRAYIPLPVTINVGKAQLDVQTEDAKVVTRMLTFQGYSRSDYMRLKQNIAQQSYRHKAVVGFDEYLMTAIPSAKTTTLKISALGQQGYFMLIMESKK